MGWVKILASTLAGSAAAIPLVVELVKYVQKAIRERNWSKVLDVVMNPMQTAEIKFETGAGRKEWVLAMAKAPADTIDYDIDMDAISDLIDSLCNMSKVVNASEAQLGLSRSEVLYDWTRRVPRDFREHYGL